MAIILSRVQPIGSRNFPKTSSMPDVYPIHIIRAAESTCKYAYNIFEGKKEMFGVHLQHIEYSSYQSEGTIKVDGKTYNAVGTSEIAGGKGQRWI